MAAFALEKRVAISAVARACYLTNQVFHKLVSKETLTKGDKSPVTVADFAAQAMVNEILSKSFSGDKIVGEEDSADLRAPSTASEQIRTHLTSLANEALQLPLRDGENSAWGIGPVTSTKTSEELLAQIDRGNYAGGSTGRFWALDPIDGTKGFLRGGQYAVCLALVVDSIVELGVIGCPNLPVSSYGATGDEVGCLFVAVRGQGSEQRPLSDPSKSSPIRVPTDAPVSNIAILESFEGAHSSHSVSERLSKQLGLVREPLRMDSQAKYACLARGEGGLYFRVPIAGQGYKEKIWDHAPGSLLVTESGGVITDGRGEPLNFGLGRTLGENHGIIAGFKGVHSQVLEALKRIQQESS